MGFDKDTPNNSPPHFFLVNILYQTHKHARTNPQMPSRTRKRHKRNPKKRFRRTVGGLFGATRDAFNSGDLQHKQGEENSSYIATVTQSSFWKTHAKHSIEYIVPNNFLLLKNPSSFFAPRFQVHIGHGKAEQCYIRVAEPNNATRIKFVEYFVRFNGNWYCMMRIFGINTGLLATWTNVVFYKLKYPNWITVSNNSIHLPADAVIENSPSDLNILQKTAMKNEGKIVQIVKGLEPVTSGEEYLVLRQFRNGQVINAGVKEEAAKEVGEGLLRGVLGL